MSQKKCRVTCMAGQHHISSGKHSPADAIVKDFGAVRERTGKVAGANAGERASSSTLGRGMIFERTRYDSRDFIVL